MPVNAKDGASIWECHLCRQKTTALVLAWNRQAAKMTCAKHLAWDPQQVVGFRAPEMTTTFLNCGGGADAPVIVSRDQQRWCYPEELDEEASDA